MPRQTVHADDGSFATTIPSFARGLLTAEAANLCQDGTPAAQNIEWLSREGVVQRISGAAAFRSMTIPDNADAYFGNLFALYMPASGSSTYVVANSNGEFYTIGSGGSSTPLRRLSGQSTSVPGSYWCHAMLGDYLIISINPPAGRKTWKYDGTRLIPLGAKHIADMESGETTWAGGSANTTTYIQGAQARSTGVITAGASVTMTLTPASALNLVAGLLSARDYATSDNIHFYVNLSVAANLNTGASYIRFGNAGDTAYFQLAASSWGTLANGWNEVSVAKSSFATTGAPNWNSIAKMTLFTQAQTGDLTAIYDDVYVVYATVFPAVRALTAWRNMLLGINSSANPSQCFYTKIGSPDDYDSAASISVDLGDGSPLSAIHSYYDQVFLAKYNSIYNITGSAAGLYPTYDLLTTLITKDYGCSSWRSVVEANNRLYFWWQGGLYVYDGTVTRLISLDIQPTLDPASLAGVYNGNNGDGINVVEGIHGLALNRLHKIIWFHTNFDTSNQYNYATVYDYAHENFVQWVFSTSGTLTLYINPVMSLRAKEVASTTSAITAEIPLTVAYNGNVYQWDTGNTIYGNNVTAFVTTPWLDADLPFEGKEWSEVHVNFLNNTGNLLVEYRIANHPREWSAAAWTTASTFNMATANEFGRARIGERARWLQVRIGVTNAIFTLVPPVVVTGTRLYQPYA